VEQNLKTFIKLSLKLEKKTVNRQRCQLARFSIRFMRSWIRDN